MGNGAVAAQVEIPPVRFFVQSRIVQPLQQNIVALFALAAADDLADPRHEHVHRAHGFAVVVGAHVKRLDRFWVIRDDQRFFENLFGQKALVFGLQIAAPLDGKLPRLAGFFQLGDGLGVSDVAEIGLGDMLQGRQDRLLDELIEKLQILAAVFEDGANNDTSRNSSASRMLSFSS